MLKNQVRAHRTQPKMIMRTSPVRYMIIDSIASRTCAFFSSREMADITIIIITPHQRHIIRHLQSGMINIEHFFIGNKNLRDFSYLFINVFLNQPALIRKHTIYHGLLFLHCLCSLHLAIVHTTHTQRIEYFLTCHFFDTVFPEFINCRSIIYIIISPLSSSLPLAGSIASHRFAMGSANEDSIFLRSFPVTFSQKKRKRTFMHCRPIGIGSQTKQ